MLTQNKNPECVIMTQTDQLGGEGAGGKQNHGLIDSTGRLSENNA